MNWVNLLKYQYLWILEWYDAHPELRRNTKEKKLYKALLDTKSAMDFRVWQKMVKDSGIAFTNTDSPALSDNELAVLDDFAAGAEDKVLGAFIEWKKGFSPKRWREISEWNCDIVDILYKATKRQDDGTLIVFPCGNRWAAIGQDADRLFELFGWQTGAMSGSDEPISWMFISKHGMKVLEQSRQNILVKDFGEFDVISTSFEEDAVCELQQFIDYLRYTGQMGDDMVAYLRKIRPVIVENIGYRELTQGTLSFDKNRVLAHMPGGRSVTLADGPSWRLDNLGRSCMDLLREKTGKE